MVEEKHTFLSVRDIHAESDKWKLNKSHSSPSVTSSSSSVGSRDMVLLETGHFVSKKKVGKASSSPQEQQHCEEVKPAAPSTSSSGAVHAGSSGAVHASSRLTAPAPDYSRLADSGRESWSIGALNHDNGTCRPCAWNWRIEGCSRGEECSFCHMCDKSSLKQVKKQYRRNQQEEKRLHREAAANTPMYPYPSPGYGVGMDPYNNARSVGLQQPMSMHTGPPQGYAVADPEMGAPRQPVVSLAGGPRYGQSDRRFDQGSSSGDMRSQAPWTSKGPDWKMSI